MEYEEWENYLKDFISAYNNLSELSPILGTVAPLLFQFRISDNPEMNFWFSFETERVIQGMGENSESSIPKLYHIADFDTMRNVLSGTIDPISATSEGKYKIIGDMNILTACTPLLPLNEKAHNLIKNIKEE